MGTNLGQLKNYPYICSMFERKNNNPINNVTWNGVLLYLHLYVTEDIMNVIYDKEISEKDAVTLLGVSEDDIYQSRRKYLLDHNVHVFRESHSYPNQFKIMSEDKNWVTFNIDNHARVA